MLLKMETIGCVILRNILSLKSSILTSELNWNNMKKTTSTTLSCFLAFTLYKLDWVASDVVPK